MHSSPRSDRALHSLTTSPSEASCLARALRQGTLRGKEHAIHLPRDARENREDRPQGHHLRDGIGSRTIAIVTTEPGRFSSGSGLVGKIAKAIKKKVVVRTHPSIRSTEEATESFIRKLLPDEAEITAISFDACYGEVIVQAKNPGKAVGPRGANNNAIRDECGWLVKVERTPPIQSKTIHDVRGYRQAHAAERRKLLKDFGLNMLRPKRPGSFWVRTTALGSYREVGRACHLVTTNESRIMIDVGVNIASDTDPMPYFTAPEALPLDKLDAVVLTHAHLDHAGMLPVLFKYGYRGPVYCTPPTRDLMLLLQTDYIKVGGAEGKNPAYGMEDIRTAMKHVVDVEWNDTTDVAPDVKLTFTNAGHILGSSSVHLHVGEGKHNIVFSKGLEVREVVVVRRNERSIPTL